MGMMRRALLLLLLAACGKPPAPPPDLSWMWQPSRMDQWIDRFPVVNRAPVLKGKVLIVNIDRREVSRGMMDSLPRELQPSTPESVGTVVWVHGSKVPVGKFQGGITEYQESLEVSIIDLAARELIHWKTFDGGRLGDTIRLNRDQKESARREGVSGGNPTVDAMEFLRSLPRS
jgi:hypothetical protein